MLVLCLCCNVQARADGFPDRKRVTKWRELHASARCPGQSRPRELSMCSADDLFLHLPRTRDAWTVLQTKHLGAASLTADLSQSVTRAGVCTDGRLPCVTPGSILAVGAACRLVTPLEKLLVHGIPVHRMRFPPGLTPRELEAMGGNTMHVHVLGVAILMLLAFVNWDAPAASIACEWKIVQGPKSRKPRSKVQGPRPKAQGPRSKVQGRCQKRNPSLLEALGDRWSLKKCTKMVIKHACKPKRNSKMSPLMGTRWG
eukprot:Skav228888  [mRNA]  locus=scaffold194:149567:150337:+ [translate_table: standard]